MKNPYFIVIVLTFLIITGSVGQVPGTLSYQGILLESDGITPMEGSKSIEFNFYTVPINGTADPTLKRTVSVTATKGLFTCVIGDGGAGGAALPSTIGSQQYYVGIKVDGGAELSPRVQLTPAAYAFQAQSSYTISDNAITSNKIADESIVNADINASAAIEGTKISPNFGSQNISTTGTITGNNIFGNVTGNISGNSATVTTNANLTGDVTSIGNATSIAPNSIVNADINSGAAIAGTKVSPNFGSQNISTTGTLNSGAITATSFSGNGSSITSLTAANLVGSATLPNNVLDTDLQDLADGLLSGAGRVSGNAITSGTISGTAAINTDGDIRTDGSVGVGLGLLLNPYSFYARGSLSRTGYFYNSATSGTAYAIRSDAVGSGTSSKYAVYGVASGSGSTNYGIYGDASGATTNWAGYFDGDVTVNGNFFSNAVFTDPVFLGPTTDNFVDLGCGSCSSPLRFKRIYLMINPIVGSDVRFKERILDLEYGLKHVNKLRPVSYTLKGDNSNRTLFGFIAQEVKAVMPEIVLEDGSDEKKLSLSYSEIIPVLVNAIKEQQFQIEELKLKNDDLQKRLENVEAFIKRSNQLTEGASSKAEK